jgi:uncharacterized protein YggU (UPF0235/DUF167 family)
VTVVTGHRSRKKRLRLESLALADLLLRLNEVLEGG